MIYANHVKSDADELTRGHPSHGVDRLLQSPCLARLDVNLHQVALAGFTLHLALQEDVPLAGEVDFGKTSVATIVLCHQGCEPQRQVFVVCPGNSHRQRSKELVTQFAVRRHIVDAQALHKQAKGHMLYTLDALARRAVVIMSYHFAARPENGLRAMAWGVVVIDDAHKLRNEHDSSRCIAQAVGCGLTGHKMLLVRATPWENSFIKFYGLSTLLDEPAFGEEGAFRSPFINASADCDPLRAQRVPLAQRTLRRDVLEYIKSSHRRAKGINRPCGALLTTCDMPWNPQRVEQGVVVINFLNTRNHDDQRILELLKETFNIFLGVVGPSDEVLGRMEGGLAFEKRILHIDETCRQPEQLEAAFNALEAGLAEAIADRTKDSQCELLEHFDEDKMFAAAETLRHMPGRITRLKRDERRATTLQERDVIECDLGDLLRKQRHRRLKHFPIQKTKAPPSATSASAISAGTSSLVEGRRDA